MKQCCQEAIKNYLRNKELDRFIEVAKFASDLDKTERLMMVAFIQGMKS